MPSSRMRASDSKISLTMIGASLLWVGAGLAIASAILLAFVPRLPSSEAANGFGLSNGSVRITSGTNRRLRLFAVTQIAASSQACRRSIRSRKSRSQRLMPSDSGDTFAMPASCSR